MEKQVSSSDKKTGLTNVLLGIAFSFTVWFFTPSEIFIRNQKDFVIGAGHIIVPMLLTAAAAAAYCILMLHLLRRIGKGLYTVVSRLLFGVLLAFYVQELFCNGRMTALTGENMIANSVPAQYSTLNAILMYVILICPLILTYFAKKHPEKKLLQFGSGSIIPYLSAIILAMQTCGFIGSAVQFGFSRYTRSGDTALSYAPVMSLSEEQNVIVFLVDKFDGMYLDEMLEQCPELYEEFEGFTFYQNNISRYTSTFPSIPSMLTQQAYENEDWGDYFEKAWQNRTFLDVLKDSGYRINLLCDNATTYTNLAQIEARCDNIVQIDPSEYDYNYLGGSGVIPVMTHLSLGKLCPYAIKDYFLNIDSDFSTHFRNLDSRADACPASVGTYSDLKFYQYLTAHQLTADAPKTFSFIHLIGCHDRSDELEALYDDPEPEGAFQFFRSSRGDMEILFEFFRQMKACGTYDCSTIIVLGDHGHQVTPYDPNLDFAITTSLLIKPAHAEPQTLRLDPVSELSNQYFAASVLEYAGLDHSEFGSSYSDIIENDLRTERCFQIMDWHGYGDVSKAIQFRITGSARDLANWELLEPS